MQSPEGLRLGSSITTEKATSFDTAFRQVVAAPAGKTMFQTVMNGLEEATAYLHQHKNLNRRQAQDSRRDLNKLDIKKLSKSAFGVKQVTKVEDLASLFTGKDFNQSNIADILDDFVQDFSKDFTQQHLALLSLKQSLIEKNTGDKTLEPVLQELNRRLDALQKSREFDAGTLGYNLIAWASEQGADAQAMQQAFVSAPAIRLDNLQQALDFLKTKFTQKRFVSGTAEIFKELSAQYHAGGATIDNTQLVHVMSNMSQLKVLLALYDECCALAGILLPRQRRQDEETSFAGELLGELLGLQGKSWAQMQDVSKMATNLGLTDVGEKNILGVQLKRIVGLIPSHLYIEQDQKQQCLDVIFQFADLMGRTEAEHA